jgi:hypothetical protein
MRISLADLRRAIDCPVAFHRSPHLQAGNTPGEDYDDDASDHGHDDHRAPPTQLLWCGETFPGSHGVKP